MSNIKPQENLPAVSYAAEANKEGASFAMRGGDLVITTSDGREIVMPFAGDLMLSSSRFVIEFNDGAMSSLELMKLVEFAPHEEEDSQQFGITKSNVEKEEVDLDELIKKENLVGETPEVPIPEPVEVDPNTIQTL